MAQLNATMMQVKNVVDEVHDKKKEARRLVNLPIGSLEQYDDLVKNLKKPEVFKKFVSLLYYNQRKFICSSNLNILLGGQCTENPAFASALLQGRNEG